MKPMIHFLSMILLVLVNGGVAAGQAPGSNQTDGAVISSSIQAMQAQLAQLDTTVTAAAVAGLSQQNPLARQVNLAQLPFPHRQHPTQEGIAPLITQMPSKLHHGRAEFQPEQENDLSNPSNPVYNFTPYRLINPSDSLGVGLTYSGGFFPGWQAAHQLFPAAFDLNAVRQPLPVTYHDPAYIQALNQQWQQTNDYILQLGQGMQSYANQFQQSQLGYPSGWFDNSFNSNYYGGQSFGLPANVLSVLNYNPNSAVNFQTQFLTNLNGYLTQPWTGNGYFLAGASAQAAQTDSLTPIRQRYEAIGGQQQDLQYLNQDLLNLRANANAVLMYTIYTDPEFLYWDAYLAQVLNTILTQHCPSYALLQATGAEILSWQPTADAQQLAARNQKRLDYRDWQAAVDAEAQQFLAANPSIVAWLNEVITYLHDLQTYHWGSTEVESWFGGWSQDLQNAYRANLPPIGQSMEQLFADYPALQEYLQLSHEVMNMDALFKDDTGLRNLEQRIEQLAQDPTMTQQLSTRYEQYNSTMATLLTNTPLLTDLESFYERVDQLVAADPVYQALAQIDGEAGVLFADFQWRVFQAVDACYAAYGTNCDPYRDPTVVATLNSANVDALTDVLGLFYETASAHWYTFYTGKPRGSYDPSAYPALEQQTQTTISQGLTPVQTQLDATRQNFTTQLTNLPQINNLMTQTRDVLASLRGKSGSAAGLSDHNQERNAAQTQLDVKLNRMAVLAQQIRNGNSLESAVGNVNCDPVINTLDALLVMQHVAGLRRAASSCSLQADEIYVPACDMDGNQSCNTIDALVIMQCTAKIANPFCTN